MSVGVLAHLFGGLPYRELGERVEAYGFRHIQLALWKAFTDVDFSQPGRFSPGLALDIAEQLDKHRVSISVLGCYLHFFERDKQVLRHNIERFKELLRYARFLGAPMVAFETGHFNGTPFTDEDWVVMKQTMEELVEEAERWGVYIGLEAAHGHLIGTAPELRRMLDEVPSSSIGVVIDAGNLMHADNFANQDQVMTEAFELLGPRIIAAHAKDRKWNEQGQLITVPAGEGEMNYPLYMKLLQQYKPGVQIVMEEARPDQMQKVKAFLDSFAQQPTTS